MMTFASTATRHRPACPRLARRLCVLILASGPLVLAGPVDSPKNLIPNPDFVIEPTGAPLDWTQWAPNATLKPAMSVRQFQGGLGLSIVTSHISQFGYWRTVIRGIRPGQFYRFSSDFDADSVERHDRSVIGILSWCSDAEGQKPIQRDYAKRQYQVAGVPRLEHLLQAPVGAASLRVELGLRWEESGSVLFFNPELMEAAPPNPRLVTVVTTHGHPPTPSKADRNLSLISTLLDRAGERRPDIILLPEALFDYGIRAPLLERSTEIPGPVSDLLSRKARQYRTYIVAGMNIRTSGLSFNTAALFDRQGRIAGVYRKVHLPLSEAEDGSTPGSEYPVFDTDFGRLGLLICWDVWFPEPARILRLQGAEMILAPVAGDVSPRHWDVTTRARAIDNAVYFVTANTEGGSASRIVDPDGEVMAETEEPFGIASASIDLNHARRVRWLSVGDAEGEPASLYLQERRPETYKVLTADPASAAPRKTP